MRKLFNQTVLILILLSLISCNKKFKPDPKDFYINENFVLVGTNETTGLQGKIRKPVLIKMWLIKSISHPEMHREITQNTPYVGFSDSQWYSTNIGDTLHYDYMRKTQFFKIKNK